MRALSLVACALALGTAACGSLPHYYAPHPCDRPDLTGCLVETVTISGAQKVPPADIKAKIATAETSHALGGLLKDIPVASIWDRITVDYSELDPFVLERDMARVERLYRARGYYEAHARVARVRKVDKEHVRVEIVVEEGEPVVVHSVKLEWKDGQHPSHGAQNAAQRSLNALVRGAPFPEQVFEDLKKRLVRALTDRGYAYAKAEAHATVDLLQHRADVVYTAEAGPVTKFGPVRIEGAGDLPEGRLRQAIGIKEGESYSTARLDTAVASLTDLRVLGSVDVTSELPAEGQPRVTEIPIVFHLAQTTLKTLKFGGGVELGSRVGVHGVAGWENRNFFGGLRSFTIEGKPGLIFFPYTLASLFGGNQASFELVPELRVHTALSQPGFLEDHTRGLVTADLNMYQLQPTDTLGYLEFVSKTGLERDLWTGRVHLGLYANAQIDQPLQLQIPGAQVLSTGGGYHFLVVPSVQSTFALDLRTNVEGKRDPINPHSGFYLANDVQVAAAGSQDVRVRPEARGYIPVGKRVTLALKVGAGFLYAFGGGLSETPVPNTPYVGDDKAKFLHQLPQRQLTGCVARVDPMTEKCPSGMFDAVTGVCMDDTRSRWIQLMQLRGFNSGGTNSNRGYGYSAVGPQEVVPGISPTVTSYGSALYGGALDLPTRTCTPLPTATGGMAMWEASAELRISPIYDKLGLTFFVDGSDVRQRAADFGAPFAPHLTVGLGIHYATPVGPLRADFGFRVPGAQVIGSTCAIFDPSVLSLPAPRPPLCDPALHRDPQGGGYLDPKYGQAGTIRGVPLAISLAIGEAF